MKMTFLWKLLKLNIRSPLKITFKNISMHENSKGFKKN